MNTLGCRLSCKNKSIKRESCFEEQTPFCGLLLVSTLNSCLEYRLNEVSCAYLHFLSVLPKTFVKYKSSRFFYRQTRSYLESGITYLTHSYCLFLALVELITYRFQCLVYFLFQLHDIGRYYFLTYLLT